MQSPGWAVIAETASTLVQVERSLYVHPGEQNPNGNCYVHVRITNNSSNIVGIDLRTRSATFFPECSGPGDSGAPIVTDCVREIDAGLDPPAQHQLLADFRAHRLVEVGPRGSVDYFRDFSGTPDGECETARDGKVLSVDMGGSLLVVAQTIELLRPARSLAIPLVRAWPAIPGSGRIISP
jgi:hypothetical protein